MRIRAAAFWLTFAFVFTVPWEAAISLGELGRLSKFVGLAAGVVWAVSLLERRRIRRPHAFQVALYVFILWAGLTYFWSLDPRATVSGLLTIVQLFAMVLILWDLCDTERAVERMLQAYVLGAFVSSGAIIFNFVTYVEAEFPERRFLALGFQVDAIALIVAIAGPAAWYLAAGPGRGRLGMVRIVNYAYLPVGAFALILTGTRGAVLASIPTGILVLWSLWRIRGPMKVAAIGALAFAVVGVIAFAPKEPLERIASVTTAANVEEQGALSGRWAIWGGSRQAFYERPIAGAGLSAHRAALAGVSVPEVDFGIPRRADPRRAAVITATEAHNAYLSVAVETGLVGLLLLVWVILVVVAGVRTLSGWRFSYWTAQLSVIAIGAMSLSVELRKDVWIFLALAVATAEAVRSTRRSPQVQSVPLRASTRLRLQRSATSGAR